MAEIPDVRIHDLRHTFASLLVSGGAILEMIGRLLGHTQIGTTQRYAHLIDSPLRAGVNAVGEMLKPRLKVVGGQWISSQTGNRCLIALQSLPSFGIATGGCLGQHNDSKPRR